MLTAHPGASGRITPLRLIFDSLKKVTKRFVIEPSLRLIARDRLSRLFSSDHARWTESRSSPTLWRSTHQCLGPNLNVRYFGRPEARDPLRLSITRKEKPVSSHANHAQTILPVQ